MDAGAPPLLLGVTRSRNEQTPLELRDWSPYAKDALIGISLVPEELKQS